MFQSVRQRKARAGAAVVDIAPLIDIVFILLIFFLVTTTFVRDTGVLVQRPQATATQTLEPTAMRISITETGSIYTEGQSVTLEQLRDRVQQFVARERQRAVIVIPDRAVPSGRLIEVMDEARLAGARDVAVATERQN